jgi:glucokinase
MVTLGTGVGGGIVVDGKIVAGANGAGGEIGHIMMNEDETDVCGCGKSGCLEQYASATGIVRMAKHMLDEDNRDSVLRTMNDISAKDIFDAAKSGDEVAKSLVDALGKMLGTALANVACVVNPEVFVIGGGVSKAGSILIDVIQKYYEERTFHACRGAKFTLASLENDAGMYGCVQMLLD